MNRRFFSQALFRAGALTRLAASYALGQSRGCPLTEAWQAMYRKVDRHGVWLELQASARVVCEEDELVLWEIAGEQYWTSRESRVLPGLIEERDSGMYDGKAGPRSGDTVLDCGAHIGTFAIAALARGAVRVIAVEPAPDNLECLRRNLSQPIAAGRVAVRPVALWDRETLLVLRVVPRNPAANSVALNFPGSHPGPQVRTDTIDALVDRLQLGRVDFLKLDVEGAECEALVGARRTLQRWRPRLAVAAEHRVDDAKRIPEMVRSIRGDYQLQLGPWVLGRHSIRPQVLHFF